MVLFSFVFTLDNIIMARNVAKVLSASDCETQNNNYENNEVKTCKRKKKKIQNTNKNPRMR